MEQVNVLNGGFVRLVDHMGNDLSIIRSARVSYDADWRNEIDEKIQFQIQNGPPKKFSAEELASKDEKLLHYLMKNKHTSPFESVQFTFEVKAPIFVFRQWHRHRTWSYNEISARYTELDEGYYVPELEQITTQSSSNKQMRTNEQHPNAGVIADIINQHCGQSFERYQTLIQMGCPRELARSVLPVAAYSRMFASVNLHNLMHFLRLRLHEHAQYEIRVYAEAIVKLISPIVPVTMAAFKQSL